MGLVFIPVYIDYLGMEAFGLIGVLASLQAWFALLDMGMTPTLTREMARFQAGEHTRDSIWALFRSLEILYVLIAALIALAVMLLSGWLATDWLHAESLSSGEVAQALAVTGIVIALRWIGGVYRSAIMGLQRQVWLNGCNATFATLRGAGSVLVLAWVSPTIHAFFIFQGIVAALEAAVLAAYVRRQLPPVSGNVGFSRDAIRRIWKFAGGVSVIAILSIVLVQLDKLLLSNLLSLKDFGLYTLAGLAASTLYLLVYPINNTAAPKLSELVALGDQTELARAYHHFSQLLTLSLVPAALVLVFFSDHVLLLWTRDVSVAASVGPILSLLAVGTMMHGLMHIPYSLQLAHGWTRLSIGVNGVSVIVLGPSIYWGVTHYGMIAGAAIWALLNVGYLMVSIPLMHRKLLLAERNRWYTRDVLFPTLASLVIVIAAKLIAPAPSLDSWPASLGVLSVTAIVALGAAVAAIPAMRRQLCQRAGRYLFCAAR